MGCLFFQPANALITYKLIVFMSHLNVFHLHSWVSLDIHVAGMVSFEAHRMAKAVM
jgi:hypothetical protein